MPDFNTMTEEGKLAAVQQNVLAIEYIRNPSEAVQVAAIKQSKFEILIDFPDQFSKKAINRAQAEILAEEGVSAVQRSQAEAPAALKIAPDGTVSYGAAP